MARIDLSIDLEDDLPPAVATLGSGPKGGAQSGPKGPLKSHTAPIIAITSVPVAITVSYARVHCLTCGDESQQMLGIFLESRLSNGVRALQRKSLRELGPFAGLPRRLDVAPAVAVEICPTCFGGDRTFRRALAGAMAQGELDLGADPVPEPVRAQATTLAQELSLSIDLSEEQPK